MAHSGRRPCYNPPMDFLINNTFNVVTFLSALTMVAHAILAMLLVALLMPRMAWAKKLLRGVSKHALTLMLIVALTATAGSLFMSEIAGWAPCKYCWIQRILMYPQVVILAIALWKKDPHAARYILALSLIGIAYASYHYYIQLYDIVAAPTNPATPCDASGESCVKTPFLHFGYITIPMMALSAFALNALGSAMLLRKGKTV